GIRLALHQIDRAHDHAGRAEAALQAVVLAERGLHRVQLAVLGQTLDRGHLGALRPRRQHGADLDRLAVDVDRAGAALAGVAADVGAGQIEVLAQELDEEGARLDLARHCLTVHRHGNASHSVSPLTSLPFAARFVCVMRGSASRAANPGPARTAVPMKLGEAAEVRQRACRSAGPGVAAHRNSSTMIISSTIAAAAQTNLFCQMLSGGAGGAASGISSGTTAASGTATGSATCLVKLSKNSSAIFFAVASIRREPSCASLPPTSALAV